jgi:hypothetical protein
MNNNGKRKSIDKKKILEETLEDLEELYSLTGTKKISEKSQENSDKFTSKKKKNLCKRNQKKLRLNSLLGSGRNGLHTIKNLKRAIKELPLFVFFVLDTKLR